MADRRQVATTTTTSSSSSGSISASLFVSQCLNINIFNISLKNFITYRLIQVVYIAHKTFVMECPKVSEVIEIPT